MMRMIKTVVVTIFSVSLVALSGGSANAATAQVNTPLPDPNGSQGLAVNGSGAFLVYDGSAHGHAVAVSKRTSRVAWRAKTASGAALIAATPTIVWTAGDGQRGSLVAQDAATGRTLRTFHAPGHGSWDTLAADGTTLYALSHSAGLKHQKITTFTGDRRTRTVSAHVPSACNSTAGGGSVFFACFDTVNAVYRVNPRTGAVLARTVQPGLDGGATDLAYLRGSVYFTTSHQSNTQPAVVHRVKATTLAGRAHSVPQNVLGIAAAGEHVVALQTDSENGHVLVLDRTTLKTRSSIAILTSGYPFFLSTTTDSAYVVQTTGYAGADFPFETLVRVPLPAHLR